MRVFRLHGPCGYNVRGEKRNPRRTRAVAKKTKQESEQPQARPVWGRLFWLVTAGLWALYLAWVFIPVSPETIEHYYTRGFFRVVEGALTPLTGPVPFSCSIALIALILIGYPLCWAAYWIYQRRVRHRSHFRGLFWGFKAAAFLVPIVLIWFVTFWGAGYRRVPAEERLELDQTKISDTESEQLRATLLEVIKRDLPAAPEDRDVDRAIAAVSAAMSEIIEEWDGVPVRLPKGVKATPKGMLLMNSTSGICSPLTLEPHVDGGLPDAAFVSCAAHEIGHIAGICSEAEANLISYVAGLRADDAFARYAVALRLYTSFARQLKSEQRKAAMEALPEEALEDLRKASEASAKYRFEWLSERSWKVYNKYLQSQGIKEGVKNYARGTALFVFAWRKGLVEIHEAPSSAPVLEEGAPPA